MRHRPPSRGPPEGPPPPDLVAKVYQEDWEGAGAKHHGGWPDSPVKRQAGFSSAQLLVLLMLMLSFNCVILIAKQQQFHRARVQMDAIWEVRRARRICRAPTARPPGRSALSWRRWCFDLDECAASGHARPNRRQCAIPLQDKLRVSQTALDMMRTETRSLKVGLGC